MKAPVLLAAFAAALSMSQAAADGLQASGDARRHDAACRSAGKDAAATGEAAGCVRIRGHIPAGSDFAAKGSVGQPPSPLKPLLAPVVTGIGAIVTPIGSVLSQGPFFLTVRHDDDVR